MSKTLSYAVGLLALTTTWAAAEPITRFDVAEDHTRFVFAASPVHDNGMPAHGNQFVAQGYIYPAGTIADGVAAVLADGSPAFPDKVLGTWTCDGVFIGEGGNATTGVWLISRQVYEFADGDILVSQGPEFADAGLKQRRAITGGTGGYAEVEGVVLQTLVGFNEHMGVLATFEVRSPGADAEPGEQDHTEWDSGFPVGPVFDQGNNRRS